MNPHLSPFGAHGEEESIVDLNLAYALYLRDVEHEPAFYRMADAVVPADMRRLFESGDTGLEAAKLTLAHALELPVRARGPSGEPMIFPAAQVRLRAPIQPKKFFHTAGNFREHHEEAEKLSFSHPVLPAVDRIFFRTWMCRNFRAALGIW